MPNSEANRSFVRSYVDTNDKKQIRWYQRQWMVDMRAQNELIIYLVTMGTIFFFSGALASNVLQRLVALKGNGWHYEQSTDVVLLSVIVIFIVSSFFIGIVISNRMAGPINRIVREMERAKKGEKVGKIEVRSKDYYQNLSRAFNDVVEQLNKISERGDVNPEDKF